MTATHDSRPGTENPQHFSPVLSDLLGRGLHLFPLHSPNAHTVSGCSCSRKKCSDVGKHPACRKPDQDSTTDTKRVARWVKSGRNIGIACGPSGIVVIDEDEHGEFERFCTAHGISVPETFTVSTAKGRHFYFRAPIHVPIGNSHVFRSLDYAIDVRGKGGYVVAPGSEHESGHVYMVIRDCEITPLSDVLIDVLTSPGTSAGRPPVSQSKTDVSTTGRIGIARSERQGGTGAKKMPTNHRGYGLAALREEIERIEQLTEGNRNTPANTAIVKLGKHVGAGNLTRQEVVEAAMRAQIRNGRVDKDGLDKVAADIERQIDDGIALHEADASTEHPVTKTGGRSSWAPVDVTAHLDGTYEAKKPTVLLRTDGQPLLYPAAMHAIYGEPESGKSWAFLLAAKEILQRPTRERVLLVDFESDPGEIIGRLTALGTSLDAIRERFVYVQPEHRPRQGDPSFESLVAAGFTLVGIDGITACLALFGCKGDSGDDFASWTNEFPKRFSRGGASVLMMDHVTKSQDGRGRFAIGTQYKLGAIDGAAFTIEMVNAFGRGIRGEAVIRLAKDRSGALRANAGDFRKGDRTQEIGRLVIDATDQHNISGEMNPPTRTGPGVEIANENSELREQISRYIEEHPGIRKRALEDAIPGTATHFRMALDVLIADGYVTRKVVKNAQEHKSVKPYRQPSGYRISNGGTS